MKVACDFCGNTQVKYKFPNPEIKSAFLNAQIPIGYFLACIDCTIMLEDGAYIALVHKALALPEYRQYRDMIDDERAYIFQRELTAMYGKISKKREPF